MRMTPGQTKSSFFLMLHLMGPPRWFPPGWPYSKAQLCTVTTMPSSRRRTGKDYNVLWEVKRKITRWKLAALELDSILFITSQVYNCNSLQRNLQFLGNRKGWFTQMPEIGDSFRRTWAKKRHDHLIIIHFCINAVKRRTLVYPDKFVCVAVYLVTMD